MTEEQLSEYVGEFRSQEVDTRCIFAVKGGKLIAKHKKHGEKVFTAKDKDIFVSDGWWIKQAQFVRDNDGQISDCLVSTGRVKDVKFIKVGE